LCFRKVKQEIFLELDETKDEVPNYMTRRWSPKESRRQTRGQPHLGLELKLETRELNE
jgi:hypothetical protein